MNPFAVIVLCAVVFIGLAVAGNRKSPSRGSHRSPDDHSSAYGSGFADLNGDGLPDMTPSPHRRLQHHDHHSHHGHSHHHGGDGSAGDAGSSGGDGGSSGGGYGGDGGSGGSFGGGGGTD